MSRGFGDASALLIAPTHVAGLVEFSRTGCGHGLPGPCPLCLELASRAELEVALGYVTESPFRRKARIGQTLLDAAELRLILARLGEFDAGVHLTGAAS